MRGPNGTMLALVIGIMMAVSYGTQLFEKGTFSPPKNDTPPISTTPPAKETDPALLPKPLSGGQKNAAMSDLDSLKVEQELYAADYDRRLFPHWRVTTGPCDGRVNTLKRYGVNVQASGCRIVSGTWYDPYSGKTFSSMSELEADHVVALKEAWRSGAKNWTTSQRQKFANDDRLVIIMTLGSLNGSKSDDDPSNWKPPLKAYWPKYAQRWILIKKTYNLTIDPREKRALEIMLNT